MWAARSRAVQSRSRSNRPPLQELRLQAQASTKNAGLTPLFRRLRLKDYDCATPLSCTSSSIAPVSCTPGTPRSTNLLSPNCIITVPCTSELPSATVPVPLRSPVLGSCTPEPPSSITPGSPGKSSTLQEVQFHVWREAPVDFCSPVDSEMLCGDGSSPPYQDTLEGPKSPTPAPPEQGPSELHPTEAGRSEPVGSEAKVTPVPLPKVALDVVSFLLPEKSLNTSSLMESLQHSLPMPTTVAGTSVAPVPTSVSPLPTAVASTSVTPVPTTVASTSISLQDLQERSMNKSMSDLPCSKDSTAQTDFLLWHYTREQVASLPRAELEGWMESACVIIEALCFRLRNWQESQQLLSSMGPAEQRDALVQTDVTHPKEEEEFYHNLYQELRRKMTVLQQQQGAEQDLLRELELAVTGMSAWSKERLLFQDTVDAGLQSLKAEQEALAQEQKQVKALVSRCCSVLERVPGKLRSCLEEQDAMRQQADKALQAKEEISCQLEKTSVALQDATARLEQLTEADSRLSADLSSLKMNLANVEKQRDALQQENKEQKEQIAWLVEERDGLHQDLQEATECREFLNQENCTYRTQLQDVEARLTSTLAALQDCSLQYNELKDAQQRLMDSNQRLQEKQAALSRELENAKAELLDFQLKRNKVSWCSEDVTKSKMRLQDLVDYLRASLQEQDLDAPLGSRICSSAQRTPSWRTPCRALTPSCRTPYHSRHSFVDSVLKAVLRTDTKEIAGGENAPTMQRHASTLKPTELEDNLLENIKELKAVVSDLTMLSYRVQELEQDNFKALQMEISDLQHRLEKVTDESEEKIDAQDATIAKLNKRLKSKIESEKQLQELVKQQEEKLMKLMDHSSEVKSLNAEVCQLKRLLQRAETEAKVLWQEMQSDPNVDTTRVQERIRLWQEVDKLQQLMLDKDDEKRLVSKKYQEQITGLELRLHQAQRELRTHEEMQERMKEVQEKMKEVLPTVPDMAASYPQLHSLLQLYLDLETGSGSKEGADM